MKILELFCGTKSFATEAKKRGHEVFTTDFNPEFNADVTCDILSFEPSCVPFKPDVIWASPPCTFFSVASIGKHWHPDHTPKTEQAILGVKIVEKTIQIIKELNPKFWFIENPRGKLRKLWVVETLPIRHTVTYCQYGDTRMKPTDIWTNCYEWNPRPICKNGDPCHESAPRGAKTGTQGLKGNMERSRVPSELCIELLDVCEQNIKEKK